MTASMLGSFPRFGDWPPQGIAVNIVVYPKP